MKCPVDSATLLMSERQGVEIDYPDGQPSSRRSSQEVDDGARSSGCVSAVRWSAPGMVSCVARASAPAR